MVDRLLKRKISRKGAKPLRIRKDNLSKILLHTAIEIPLKRLFCGRSNSVSDAFGFSLRNFPRSASICYYEAGRRRLGVFA